jgi:hypothetical protein
MTGLDDGCGSPRRTPRRDVRGGGDRGAVTGRTRPVRGFARSEGDSNPLPGRRPRGRASNGEEQPNRGWAQTTFPVRAAPFGPPTGNRARATRAGHTFQYGTVTTRPSRSLGAATTRSIPPRRADHDRCSEPDDPMSFRRRANGRDRSAADSLRARLPSQPDCRAVRFERSETSIGSLRSGRDARHPGCCELLRYLRMLSRSSISRYFSTCVAFR